MCCVSDLLVRSDVNKTDGIIILSYQVALLTWECH